MEWQTLLAYITGTVDQALLLRNKYLKGSTFLEYFRSNRDFLELILPSCLLFVLQELPHTI